MQLSEKVRELARGRWAGILGGHLDERALSGKHTACPLCREGKDRFRFDDKDGAGTWICATCGAGDGFHLLEALNGWTFVEAAKHVQSMAGGIEARPFRAATDPDKAREWLKAVWEASKPISDTDPAGLYLARRCGPGHVTGSLRFNPELSYWHDDGSVTKHPALIGRVVNSDGRPVCLHRTYLTDDGRKADVPTQKKLMTPTERLANVAIRLAPPVDGWLGVAEGIETALCASRRFQVPCWALVAAGMMKTFRPPEGVKTLFVFGDNDVTFTGQAAAYDLARSMSMGGTEARVHIPDVPGTDWAD